MTALNPFATAAIVALCAVGSPHMAQAAEPETLTLACQGTVTNNIKPDAKPEPTSMGIIVNFTTETVQGFPHMDVAEITKADDMTIVFVASYHGTKAEWGFDGTIDRVTGDLKAHWMLKNMETGNSRIVAYSLKCQPTQRML